MFNLVNVAQKFAESDEFVGAVEASTQAGYGGSGYSVELFGNGTWRVLWDNQIGNLYKSPGVIVSVPALTHAQHEDVNEEISLREVVEFYRGELADEFMQIVEEVE